ncbi:helix-turn-helix domain-containing protein [Paraburkholderia tropica]|uniref:AraC family transcriptional regulator n=1 Tax=Paraburkholderia tropica TaxID=92647 RepID=A0ABX5MGC4_9BURK|nr:AraC family transcriptional regulator [Paraburkholderia tropica]MDE1139799.1 AraC family transcriptional regulator [Paraburkholderia tropica]PXX09631.1 AraC family transcriptional regulator [Paraburkholderia tropica]PZW74691.1 AraC family transcriptional regulator [Paraburkholderia tropica]
MNSLSDSLSPPRTARHPIEMEREWRRPKSVEDASHEIRVLRWSNHCSEPLDVSSDGAAPMHCVALNLKCTVVDFDYAARPLIRGRVAAGVAHIGAPGVAARARFSSQFDVLHLFVTQRVLKECYADLFGRTPGEELTLGDGSLLRDPAIERLSQALAVSQTHDAALGKVFTDSVSLAIASRLVASQYAGTSRGSRGASELPKWRMTRVMDYVDAHLGEPIGLADMADSAGLTRMHFAAQFRQASGLRPHEYLLRRRIEHAQSMLLRSQHNVLDVALASGFRSQAHFTTVFKRFVGETPCSWRKNHDGLR